MEEHRHDSDAGRADEASASHRTCALTRAEHDPDRLIRFVADPDGEIVPDLRRKLPGRGVWLTATRDTVAEAVRRNVFARSLKRQVRPAPDLADRVETLLVKRVADALSLANKAGLVTTGFAQVDAALEKAAVTLVHAAEAAPGGRLKLDRKFLAVQGGKGQPAPIVTPLTVEQLSLAIGRPNVVHAALISGGATKKFLSEAERLERYRSGSCASMCAPAAPISDCEQTTHDGDEGSE